MPENVYNVIELVGTSTVLQFYKDHFDRRNSEESKNAARRATFATISDHSGRTGVFENFWAGTRQASTGVGGVVSPRRGVAGCPQPAMFADKEAS